MIAFWGGAFDPPHFGHIKPALELVRHSELAHLYFLPYYQSPHKTIVTDARHRLEMLKLVEQAPKITVETYELERPSVSYTIDSLTHFRQKEGADQSIAFVLGADAFTNIAQWKEYPRILDLSHLIVLARPGHRVEDTHALLRDRGGWSSWSDMAQTSAGKIVPFENLHWEVSSSRVRALLMRREQPKYLIPGSVWNYIQRNKLYGYREN